MKVLLTGFAPFGGETINPAYAAVRRLPEQIGDAVVYKRELPTSFAAAPAALLQAIGEIGPDVVFCVGQAGGRSHISLEKVAINYCHARIPDNDGAQPQDQPLCPDAPAAYFATVPVLELAQALNDQGIPATVSYTAGTYVCNAVFYTLLHSGPRLVPHLRGTFVHVPYLPQQAAGKAPGTPSMELGCITQALECLIRQISA